jgi:hypothetical protein
MTETLRKLYWQLHDVGIDLRSLPLNRGDCQPKFTSAFQPLARVLGREERASPVAMHRDCNQLGALFSYDLLPCGAQHSAGPAFLDEHQQAHVVGIVGGWYLALDVAGKSVLPVEVADSRQNPDDRNMG